MAVVWAIADPATLVVRGEAAEKTGDLKGAVHNYTLAANETANRKKLGADDLYVHAAELAMRVSQSATTEDDAVTYYEMATGDYVAASTQNPQNQVANEANLELQYERAATLAGPPDVIWQVVADTASRMIQTKPAAKSLAYRARARLYKLESKPEGFLDDDLKDAQKDVNDALKLDPGYGLANALQGQIMVDHQRVVLKRNGTNNDAFLALRALGWSWDMRKRLLATINKAPRRALALTTHRTAPPALTTDASQPSASNKASLRGPRIILRSAERGAPITPHRRLFRWIAHPLTADCSAARAFPDMDPGVQSSGDQRSRRGHWWLSINQRQACPDKRWPRSRGKLLRNYGDWHQPALI